MTKHVQMSVAITVVILLVAWPAVAQRGFLYEIERTVSPPVIDGVIDEASYPSAPYLMTADTLGPDGGSQLNDTNNPDLTATYWLTWDDEALYFAARVTDPDVVYRLNQGSPLNGTDGVQLCTDHLNQRPANVETPGIHIHDVVPGQADDPDTAAYWQHWNGNPPDTFPNAQWAGRTTAEGYEVELRLPWGDFQPAFPQAPTVGTQMGGMFLLMDFDADGLIDLWWSSGNGENIIGTPSRWNDFVLTVDPDVDYSGDGYTYQQKVNLGLDPFTPIDPDASYSGDGWTYQQKKDLGLNPFSADSSGDGVPDLWISQHFDDWVDKALDPTFGSTVLDPDTGFTVRNAYQRRVDPNDPSTWPDLTAVPVSNAATLALLVMVMLGLSALSIMIMLKRRTQ